MELIFTFIPLLIISSVLGVFSYYYFGGRKLDISEKGRAILFKEQAGGRFNGFNLTIPFVRHTIYENCVVIAYGKFHHTLEFTEIEQVDVKRHMFSKGITYHHKQKNVPSDCIVWSKKPAEVEALLKSKGVNVNTQT